ncbi:conserved hypothetical protein [Candidatus Desulfarcum epimagneticum]|uniref:UPF0102 protein EPICR_10283 n=1 Tax=uncultured Desulfobacteraceae bacterium TaxID=218296 RepID=A0A484HC89_9BACT|nr:conserved hypothetical protein [uncultured Desulfobacteraceae bacterium]
MPNERQRLGKKGEDIAVRVLREKGRRILERNYVTPLGEIDIIAKDGRTLVFVEVKTRRTLRYGNPKLAVTRKKQVKMSMAALFYLKKMKQTRQKARFDVVAIQFGGGAEQVEIVENAFDLAYG